MNKRLWLEFFEENLAYGMTWTDAGEKADRQVADQESAVVDAATDRAKEGE